MSVLQKLTSVFGSDGVEVHDYECRECGHTFESSKPPDRTKCMECLSTDVEQQ